MWFWNGEDPMEELARSVEGACKHYEIPPHKTDGWLFVDSGRQMPIKIAKVGRHGQIEMATPLIDGLIYALREAKVDVLILDPFVSVHAVPENDNGSMDAVVAAWNYVAEEANVAIHFAFHTTKGSKGQDYTEQSLRGGSAALNKLRYLRVLNRLSVKQAESIGIKPQLARQHLRIDDGGKANLLPPGQGETWFRLQSVDLENADVERDGMFARSDLVRVAVQWTYPTTAAPTVDADTICAVWNEMGDKVWRKTSTSKEAWVGIPIAKALGLDPTEMAHRKQIICLVAMWEASGVLAVEEPEDRDEHGNKRPGFVPGRIPDADE